VCSQANLGTASIYLQGIDTEQVIATVHAGTTGTDRRSGHHRGEADNDVGGYAEGRNHMRTCVGPWSS